MRLAGALVLVLTLSTGAARADDGEAARCRLRVVHALPREGGVDEKLGPNLRERLLRPPFLMWKTFRLVLEEERELKPGASAEYDLPAGRKARVTFAEHTPGERGRHRVRGTFELEGGKASARTSFTLDEGGTFLVAGEKHDGGILIYALGCKTEK